MMFLFFSSVFSSETGKWSDAVAIKKQTIVGGQYIRNYESRDDWNDLTGRESGLSMPTNGKPFTLKVPGVDEAGRYVTRVYRFDGSTIQDKRIPGKIMLVLTEGLSEKGLTPNEKSQIIYH